MKKFILLFVLLCAVQLCPAQTYAYRAYQLASKYYSYGRWTNWSDWESCNVMITIAMDDDRIVIYSQRTQIYQIVNYDGEFKDNGGGTTYQFQCLDASHLRCEVRLRIAPDDTRQLYVDYQDAMWVYNIVYVY